MGYCTGPVAAYPVRMTYVPREWSPSLVDMERIGATCSMTLARFGRCSLIFTPGAEVSIGLNSPPLAWPGFRSKVSVWLGPPVIHSKMQARLRVWFWAASSAKRGSQF